MPAIREYIEMLQPDPWREQVGFSADIVAANEMLLNPARSDDERLATINGWMHRNQPCLFGRMAAKLNLISYCILTEGDLLLPDEAIHQKIQDARTRWTRAGFLGQSRALVILAISRRIACAIPDDNVKALALRLASMYLLTDVMPDQVFHDRIWLEVPHQNRTTWEWYAGVNYFSTQGDKRWWHDHRIPAGMGFSVNSVGHLVKSGQLARALSSLSEAMGIDDEALQPHNLTSLTTALELAMKTIANASDATSGKATRLIDLPTDENGKPTSTCPVAISANLQMKDYRQYVGHYHTDFTIPSEYFQQAVARPANVPTHLLDFTYLYKKDIENPAHDTMGTGRAIRQDDLDHALATTGRAQRVIPRETLIANHERLIRALATSNSYPIAGH
jgi:hypothetical protein